ncbi:1-acyl-sn-glycerol-3-phosphate acyltransferase [Desulfatiglans anilini]|uniref:1-acyl-sn-glycerol-3-phosphate acyltransferase n=1 Tax=Desulfatiglans anilini TaxID=90728 RepID=UPI0004062B69|nr:1-acyl-sn-glycerol-3-phosphate acyltransferase [Desulfatiglans anilini]
MNQKQKGPFFPFVLDYKPGFFLSWLLYRLFRHVRFDENMTEELRQMNRDGTVVYAIKYRGRLEYLLYHYRFLRSRLPYPKIAFDLNMVLLLPLRQLFRWLRFQVGHFFKNGKFADPYESAFFRDAILSGDTALLPLLSPKRFRRQFIHAEKDPMQLLIETQKTMDRPIFMIPQLILYKKAPEKEHPGILDIFFGFKENPGIIRKIVLFFRYHRRAFIDFGQPLNLQEYLAASAADLSPEAAAAEIRQEMINRIDQQKRVILGPIMKSHQQLKEIVLRDPKVMQLIEHSAKGNPRAVKQVKKKAAAHYEEIAADYNSAYIQFFHLTLSWLWKKIYEGIEVEPNELARVRKAAGQGPLIYIPSHKSHVDYLVLNYILYDYNMHIPRVAAGQNLAFWPMGHMFRKSGAFFIRRTFKGARLYATIFARYIKALLKEGYPLEFFIEGGRSRSGKLIIPKIGFLSILLEAYQEGFCEDLLFVPASISYDRILEEKAYLKELSGGEKERESFFQILKARRFLKRKYGKIYIRFGQPISLSDYIRASGRELEPGDHRRLASHLIQAINHVTLATPLALIAAALLTGHRHGFLLSQLKATAGEFLEFLGGQKVPVAGSLSSFDEAVEETLNLLIGWKVVNQLEDVSGEETFYFIEKERELELEYYKNSIIHWFISHAFVGVSLISRPEEIKTHQGVLEDYRFLRRLFQYEFIFEETHDDVAAVASGLDYFQEKRLIFYERESEGYRVRAEGIEMLRIWAGFARTFLEAYWVAVRAALRDEGERRQKGDALKRMKNLGLRYHKLGIIRNLEALSQVTFKNAAQLIDQHILKSLDDSAPSFPEDERDLHRLAQRIYDLFHYAY